VKRVPSTRTHGEGVFATIAPHISRGSFAGRADPPHALVEYDDLPLQDWALG
jgi:hypothetical protein